MCILVTQLHPILHNPMDSVAHQAPLSMALSRQEYSSGLPFPFPGDLPDPEIEPRSPALQADSLQLSQQRKKRKTGLSCVQLLLSYEL